MSYIDWELAEYPERYKRLRCNRVIDEVTLAHVIGNVDCQENVKYEDFMWVMEEVAKMLQKVPFIKIEVPIDLRGRNYHEYQDSAEVPWVRGRNGIDRSEDAHLAI